MVLWTRLGTKNCLGLKTSDGKLRKTKLLAVYERVRPWTT